MEEEDRNAKRVKLTHTTKSLEELAAAKAATDAALAKPRFLTKEARAALALQAEVEAASKVPQAAVKPVAAPARKAWYDGGGGGGGANSTAGAPGGHHGGRGSSVAGKHSEEAIRAAELASIRAQYEVQEKKKERAPRTKRGDRMKFNFGWKSKDDTTALDPRTAAEVASTDALGFGARGVIVKKSSAKARTDDGFSRPGRKRKASHADAHWSEKPLEAMTERDWRILREDYEITVKGDGQLPNPMRNWSELAAKEEGQAGLIPPRLAATIANVGYDKPTPIQMATIPIGLQARDVLGVAQTGSGKTASFVIPLMAYIGKLPAISAANAMDGPYALILAPTHELALQIEDETRKFAEPYGYKVVSVIGGVDEQDQAATLRKGAEVIIATPGRLVDSLNRRWLVLNQCNYIVLDEADRMLEMNFEEALQTVLDSMPAGNLKSKDAVTAAQQEAAAASTVSVQNPAELPRVTAMFSATMPRSVERLAREYLRRPASVYVGTVGKAANTVEQRVEWTPSAASKKKRLRALLSSARPPVIVFVNVRSNVDTMTKYLSSEGWRPVALHGGKSQDARAAAMAGFRRGRYDVLVATDVAGRGVDVDNVSLVINFDLPSDIEKYLHRIGRTGRAGKQGKAVSFLHPEDTHIMYDLKRVLESAGAEVPDALAKADAAMVRPGTQSSVGPGAGPSGGN